MKNQKLIGKGIWLLVSLVAIILCIRELREPDLWWQLRTGEWMLSNGAYTYKDVFSYTHEGVDWVNIKWGYEVIIAWLSKFIGPEGVMFLQMVSLLTILHFLKKTYQLINPKWDTKSIVFICFGAFLFLFLHNNRINGRPEMTTYALTTIYLYLFTKFHKDGTWWILLVIPLQLLWTNTHEAYGVGLVMLLIFVVSFVIEYIKFKKRDSKKLTLVIATFALAIASTLINPNGAKLLTHYLEIYSQLQVNKFTTEIYSFTTSEYWNYITFINLVLFIITLKHLIYRDKNKTVKKNFIDSIHSYGLLYILLYFAFFYLSLQAVRNTYFFSIMSIPLLTLIAENKWAQNSSFKKLATSGIIIGAAFYLLVGSGIYYKMVSPREQYGLKISSKRTPLGAANFIKANNLKGKGFVDYLNSSYLLWDLQPNYKTYIDLRDLDIFSETFMRNIFTAYEAPNASAEDGIKIWDKMVAYDTFDYVVMSNNEQFANFNKYLIYNDPRYHLVFADGVASVYVSEKYTKLVDSLSYEKTENNVFQTFTKTNTTGLSKVITRIFWPFYTEHKVGKKEELLTQRAYYQMLQ